LYRWERLSTSSTLSTALARVLVLTRCRAPGDVQCQPAKLRRAVKDGPTGPSAASREAASLTARNSGATREITRGRGSETPARTARAGRRNGELPTSCLLLGVSAAPLPRHGNHLRGGPPDPDSHLRSCPESQKSSLLAHEHDPAGCLRTFSVVASRSALQTGGSVPLGDAVAVQPAFSGCPACRVQA
jgi:hypothetical protein